MPVRKHDHRIQRNLGRKVVAGETGFTPVRRARTARHELTGDAGMAVDPDRRGPGSGGLRAIRDLGDALERQRRLRPSQQRRWLCAVRLAVNAILIAAGCSIRRRVRSSAWSSRAPAGSTRASAIPSRPTSASLSSASAAPRCATTSPCSKPARRPRRLADTPSSTSSGRPGDGCDSRGTPAFDGRAESIPCPIGRRMAINEPKLATYAFSRIALCRPSRL